MPHSLIKGRDYIGVGATFLCHDGQGNFLMNRRSVNARDEHGKWDIGGGGLKFGETIEACLAREIKEEYCADIIQHEFLGYRDVHRVHAGQPTHWVSLDFLVHINRDHVALGDPVKMEAIRWFTLHSAPPASERHSQDPYFWQRYEEKITAALLTIPEPV